MNIAVVSISKRAGEWMLFEDASPKMMNAEVEDRHLERITLMSARLALRCAKQRKTKTWCRAAEGDTVRHSYWLIYEGLVCGPTIVP